MDKNLEIRLVDLILDRRATHAHALRVNCPFCPTVYGKPDRRSSLKFEPLTSFYYCYRCKTYGRLNTKVPTSTPSPADTPDSPDLGPPEGFELLSATTDLLIPARNYLRIRGVSPHMWETLGIGACVSGKFFGRVIVPVKDLSNNWIGWVGRSWVKHAETPYLYPSGMNRGKVLFNQQALNKNLLDPVMVVEGVFDAIHLWPDAVAVLGKPTEYQLNLCRVSPRPVVFILDGDAADEAWALAAWFRLIGKNSGVVILPAKKDPDDFSADLIKQWAQESINKNL